MSFQLIQIDTTHTIISQTNSISMSSTWFWVSCIEFLIILFLVYKIKSNKNSSSLSELELDVLKKAQGADIDMGNLMNSIHGSRDLYKELSTRCHPDRFVNSPLQQTAEEIFQEITKNKRDFKILTELKERAVRELNVSF